MKILSRVPDDMLQSIWQKLPEIRRIKEDHRASHMVKVAVSVFDHWLRDEKEWSLMDCFAGEERRERDRKLLAHWTAVFDLTPAYTARYRGRWQSSDRLVLKRYTCRDGFMRQSKCDAHKAPSQFLILPELECIYVEGWDDTNVLYFNEREKAQPILDLAVACGLYILGFED